MKKILIFTLIFVCVICFTSCAQGKLHDGIEYYVSSDTNTQRVVDITFLAGVNVEIPSEYQGYPVTVLTDREGGIFYLSSAYKTLILPETIEIISDDFFYNAPDTLQYNEYDNGLYLGTKDNPYFAFIKVKEIDLPEEMSYKLDDGVDDPIKEGLPPPLYLDNPTDATSCIIHPDTKIIAVNAFAGCRKLKSITIPGTIKAIPSGAFAGCTSLESVIIEEGVEEIGGAVFAGCKSLTSITLPSTIKECNNTFKGLSNFKTITLPSTWTSIPKRFFEDCIGLETIELPDSITEIGECAFYGCTSLKEIKLPENLQVIGGYSFWGCTSLEKIDLPDGIQEIAEYTFLECTALREAKLSENLKSIGEGAFRLCSSLESIELPESLRSIGGLAFDNCIKLTKLHIPKNVDEILSGIVFGCSSITNITVDPENEHYLSENGALYTIEKDELLAYAISYQATSFTIPETVQTIGYGVFAGSTLEEIIIPEGVTSIRAFAFARMPNIEEIVIPEGVVSIREYAFSGNPKLKEIVIPDSVVFIGERIVNGCTSLERIVWGNNLNLRQINEKSLGDCYVKELVIPQNVDEITETAFKGLSGLENIVVAEGNKRYKDIDGNLYSKDGKTLIKYAHGKGEEKFTIPSGVVKIEKYAFSRLENLKEVIISSTVKTIADYAFSSGFNNKTLTSLVAIEFSDSVETIGDGAFYYCTNLKSIDIPDSVTYMGSSAFGSCLSLETAKVGNGIKTIDWHTFKDCTSLTSVKLGNNVELIERFAFSGCTNLTDIVIPVSVKRIEEDAFSQTMNFHYKGLWIQWMILQCKSDLFTRRVNTHYVHFTLGKILIFGLD